MTYFTNSPYEKMMMQVPDGRRAAVQPPPVFPPGHPCHGCPYGRGAPCVGICYRELLKGSGKHATRDR